MNYLMEIADLRTELAEKRLVDLRLIAKRDYNILISEPTSRGEIIEEILSEEYRIAGK
jgi:hypothetical protein